MGDIYEISKYLKGEQKSSGPAFCSTTQKWLLIESKVKLDFKRIVCCCGSNTLGGTKYTWECELSNFNDFVKKLRNHWTKSRKTRKFKKLILSISNHISNSNRVTETQNTSFWSSRPIDFHLRFNFWL